MLSEIPQANEANFRLPSNERAWLHCETFYLLWGWQHRTWDSYVILSYFLLAESFLTNWKMYKLRFSSNHSKVWYISLHVFYSLRPKLSTKSCFIKQKCQLQMGIVKYKNVSRPLSTLDINTTHLNFQMKYITLAEGTQKLSAKV